MSNIVLNNGDGVTVLDSTNTKAVPIDGEGRGIVNTYEDIANIRNPYLYMRVIVRNDSQDGIHLKGEYIITSLTNIGKVDVNGIKSFKEYVAESDPNVPAYVKAITQQNIADWNNKSNFSGNYNDLTNKPIIPNVSNKVDKSSTSGLLKNDGTVDTETQTKAANAIQMPNDATENKVLGYENGTVAWVPKPSNGEDGLSAFQLAQQEGFSGNIDAWLASLKANIGAFKFVNYDSSAENTFTTGGIGTSYIGTIDSLTAGTDTDKTVVLLMNNDATMPTKTMMIVTEDDGNGGYQFVYAGNLNNAIPSNVLIESNIDGTGLANPASNALAKATDVMPLAVKLKGVTADESKYLLGEEQSKAINGNNGNLCSDNYGGHFVVNLDTNTKKVRFQAVEVSNQSTYPYGYCFYTDSEGTVAIQSEKYKLREGSANQPYELVVEVPQDAVVFKFSVGSASRDSAYCYLQTGESVGDALGKVHPDENLSTTSEKPIANKTITNFLFDNFTKEVENEHLYVSLIKVTGEVYSTGDIIANFRVYAVTPGKQYIFSAYQRCYNKVTYAFAGFYALPENYVKADINTTNVCKGKGGDGNAPYTYRDEEALGKDSYIQNMILTAPEGATHIVLVESKKVNNVIKFPANLRVVSVATEQQEDEEAIESVKTALTPTPNALLMKNVLKSQNRNYYIESVDITAESSVFESYNLKSYIDRKIATIPEGKHFMMWTDAHIDYVNYAGLVQDAIPVMAYIKEKLGISYIINGGDNLGANSNQYKAAAIIEKYMIDCFEAFGRGLINVVGNHDWNKINDNPKISDHEVWKRMFQPMEVFGDAVYAQNVLHNIETCELLTDDEKMNLTAWAKMNYYIDDNKQKIRYYVSVTDDAGSIAQGAEMINGTAGNFMVFVDFFADVLNTIPEGYDFVFVGHQRLVNENRNENNPHWIFYKLMSAWKKKTNVSLGGGSSYDSNIFQGYKTRDNKVIAKWITSGNWNDNGLRTFDFSNHKGSGRVFTLGGHYHVDRAAFTSIDNRVFRKITCDDGINGNTNAGNILYDLGNPENNAYAEEWPDTILGIDIHNTTLGGMNETQINAQRVHRYEVNGEVVDEAYNDLGADWTGNEGKVYREFYEAGARKSVKFPNGGANGSSFATTVDGTTLETPATVTRLGNVNEICCDVITITDDNHVVCTRFGAGFDRDYKLPSIPSYSIYAESAETEEQTTENAGE